MSTSNRGTGLVHMAAAVFGLAVACSPASDESARTPASSAMGGTDGAGAGGATLSGTGGSAGVAGFSFPSGSPEAGTGGSAPLSADGACASEIRDSAPVLADLFIMMDKSVSMGCAVNDDVCNAPLSGTLPPTRWTAVKDAISGFVSAPSSAGIGVGLGFFEGPDFCGVSSYAKPSVPIAPLPGIASAITSALTTTFPGGTTPTEPALAGAIEYAKSYTDATPGHTAVVVFVTDGMPNGCNSTVAGAAALAQAGFSGTPSIKTYVVGLGATAALDQIATAGSGGLEHYFPAAGDVTTGLLAALKKISTPTIRCDYAIPTNGQKLDYALVNVQTRVGKDGTAAKVGNVVDAAHCTAQGGWYYDVDPLTAQPTKITLCHQSCDPLTATDGSGLQVLIGCATEPQPVF